MPDGKKSYSQLKREAKMLGINFVGKKKEVLAKLVKETQSKPPVKDKPELPKAPAKKTVDPLKTKKKFNVVVVLKGKMEIRRYTPEIHGKGFAKLAGKFAKDRGFSLEVLNTQDQVKCPSCGHAFDL